VAKQAIDGEMIVVVRRIQPMPGLSAAKASAACMNAAALK
jgi:hypothetical protein